jgi:hypothetical protein
VVFSFTESNISLVLAANEVSLCNDEGLIMITEGFSGLGEKATCVAVSVTMAFVSVFALVSGRGVAIGNLICELVDSVELTPLSVCVELDSLLLMGVFRYQIWQLISCVSVHR